MRAFGTHHWTNKSRGKLQHVERNKDLNQSAKGYGRKIGEIAKGQLQLHARPIRDFITENTSKL